MHLHNYSKEEDNNDNGRNDDNGNFVQTITKAKELISGKLAESGIRIERKQGIAILVLVAVMMAGAAITYFNSRPQTVAEFSAENESDRAGDNFDGTGGSAAGSKNGAEKSSAGNAGNKNGTGSTGSTDESSGVAKEGSNNNGSAGVSKSEQQITVHVAGAVAKPGVYQLEDGSRINDAINAAGGGEPKADINALNLAEKVYDGEKIYVPKQGEKLPAGFQGSAVTGSGGKANNSGRVSNAAETAGSGIQSGSGVGQGVQLEGSKTDLNTATLSQLDALPGVGPVTAQRIIDYRTQHGSFKSVDELKDVSGIGPKKFEQLKPHVAVN